MTMDSELGIFPDKDLEHFSVAPAWKICGEMLAQNLFEKPGVLILDCDGVIFLSDSLDAVRVTTPTIISTLLAVEEEGGKIGLATARSKGVRKVLREYGFRLDGPLILEGGHVIIDGGKKTVLAPDSYQNFVAHVRENLGTYVTVRDTWQEVVDRPYDDRGTISICHGDGQWNGICRATFWYNTRGEATLGDADKEVEKNVIPHLQRIASLSHLSKDDYDIKLTHMDNGLGIIRLAAKIEGYPVNKGMAAQFIWDGFIPISIADGEGDAEFEAAVQQHNGKVIAVEGSHDLTPDVPQFISRADFRVRNPDELELALTYAVAIKRHRLNFQKN